MTKHGPRRLFASHDFVATPEKALVSLARHLPHGATYWEPCAGAGDLIHGLRKHAMVECLGATDISPRSMGVDCLDALNLKGSDIAGAEFFITNPPWGAEMLHPILDHLVKLRPTWLLLYSDWLFTKQAVPYYKHIMHVVSMPRVKWIDGSATTGFDNCCWILFDVRGTGCFKSGWA